MKNKKYSVAVLLLAGLALSCASRNSDRHVGKNVNTDSTGTEVLSSFKQRLGKIKEDIKSKPGAGLSSLALAKAVVAAYQDSAKSNKMTVNNGVKDPRVGAANNRQQQPRVQDTNSAIDVNRNGTMGTVFQHVNIIPDWSEKGSLSLQVDVLKSKGDVKNISMSFKGKIDQKTGEGVLDLVGGVAPTGGATNLQNGQDSIEESSHLENSNLNGVGRGQAKGIVNPGKGKRPVKQYFVSVSCLDSSCTQMVLSFVSPHARAYYPIFYSLRKGEQVNSADVVIARAEVDGLKKSASENGAELKTNGTGYTLQLKDQSFDIASQIIATITTATLESRLSINNKQGQHIETLAENIDLKNTAADEIVVNITVGATVAATPVASPTATAVSPETPVESSK